MNHSNLKKFPNFFLSPSQQKKWMSASNSPLGITRDFHDNFSPFFYRPFAARFAVRFFFRNRALLWKIFVEMSFIRRWAWKASEASPRDAKVRIILFFCPKIQLLWFFKPNLAENFESKIGKKIENFKLSLQKLAFFAVL